MQVKNFSITKFLDNNLSKTEDIVVNEEPIEIFVNGKSKYFCMRMPGEDKALAVGLCFADGLIESYSDVKDISIDTERETVQLHIELYSLNEDKNIELRFIKSSTGGIKSRDVKDFLSKKPIHKTGHLITTSKLFEMQKDFLDRQEIFPKTGGTHAAGIYDNEGNFLAFAEDIGRHNALDKCIGKILMDNQFDKAFVAILSSRLSYEMVSKACTLGLQVVAGASAPTSLAVDIANKHDIALIGFLRTRKFNIYSCPEIIKK